MSRILVLGALLVSGFGVWGGAVAQGGSKVCTSPANPFGCEGLAGDPALGPKASQISRALWIARETALDHKDSTTLPQIETGTQLVYDSEVIADGKCGCAGTYYWTKPPRPFNSVTTYVPHQSAYPLYFVAQVLSGDGGANDEVTAAMVITRSGTDQPWKIASEITDTGYLPSASPIPPPVPELGGYDRDPNNPPAGTADGWPTQLVEYYTYLKNHQAPPPSSQFLPGVMTTGTGIDANPQDVKRNGVITHFQFRLAHGPWVINTTSGTFACSDIYETATKKPADPRRYFVQPRDHSLLGAQVAPGHYRSIAIISEWATCVYPSVDHLAVYGTTNPLPILITGARVR